MNINDINSKHFTKANFGGYNAEEVDDYLRDIAIELARLENEKHECDKKIEVLADKVRDYMKDEDVLKEAVLDARKQGKVVIEEAQRNAEEIIAEANRKADQIVGQSKILADSERSNLAKIQREVADFKENLLTLYKAHIASITSMPEPEPMYSEPAMVEEVQEQAPAYEETAEDSAVNQSIAEEQRTQTRLYDAQPEPRYTDLKFGKNN